MARNELGNPWLSIWTQPRKTIRSIVGSDPKFGYLLLCIACGLPMAFNIAQAASAFTAIPLWAILLGCLVASTFLGMISISVTAWVLQVSGRLLGGKGNFQTVRAAVAWSKVPGFVVIFTWVALLIVFGSQIFGRDFLETQWVGYQAGTL